MTEAPTQAPMMQQEPPVMQTEPLYDDYWGTDETANWFFPDGKQYIVVKVMDEGDRKRFENETQTDLLVERQTQNTRFKMNLTKERHGLIMAAVCGWNLYRKNKHTGETELVHYTDNALRDWLKVASPRHVDDLSIFIRETNPWLLGDMTPEQIDEEIERLERTKEMLIRRDEGKEPSKDK